MNCLEYELYNKSAAILKLLSTDFRSVCLLCTIIIWNEIFVNIWKYSEGDDADDIGPLLCRWNLFNYFNRTSKTHLWYPFLRFSLLYITFSISEFHLTEWTKNIRSRIIIFEYLQVFLYNTWLCNVFCTLFYDYLDRLPFGLPFQCILNDTIMLR